MIARSYTKTRNLEELANRDPQLAEQVEALCRAVKAAQSFLMQSGAVSVLRFSNEALAPFIQSQDDTAAVESVAAMFANVRAMHSTGGPNKHGFPGVRFNAARNRYQAQIKIDGKKVHLGSFATAEKAAEAYEAALRQRENVSA